MPTPLSSPDYWEARYRAGGTSGAGSIGRLARYKASTINHFINANSIASMIDFGCGDASQLELLELPARYVGVDVSQAAVALCRHRFPDLTFITPDALRTIPQAEMTIAMDVIYHLTEDEVFADTIRMLFSWASRFVIVYASNIDLTWPAAHVRHRQFTRHVAATEPDWRLLAHLPNPYPYDPAAPDITSFADFYIFGRDNAPCSIGIPSPA